MSWHEYVTSHVKIVSFDVLLISNVSSGKKSLKPKDLPVD